MDLRQLEYVVAVADHGSFTRAAAAVHVAQPSLSHGIRQLEVELGVDLFVRLPRSVQPTAAGASVIEGARRVMREMRELAVVSAAVAGLESGELHLAALPTLAGHPVAPLVGAFRRRHPGIAVSVRESEDPAGVEVEVRSGQVELGFTDVTTGGAGLERVELFRQEIVAISPPGSDVSDGALTPVALARLPLVVTPRGTSTRRLLDLTLARVAAEPSVAVEIDNREAIVPLVIAGAGTALVPRRTAQEAERLGAVVHELRPAVSRRIGVLHRRTRLSPAATAMLALAADDAAVTR